MDRPCKCCIIGGLLILIFLVGTPAHPKPWRNVEPIPAADITWKEVNGITGRLETRIFTGIDTWNAAGTGGVHAGDNQPATTQRWEIESSFTMHE